MSRPSVLPQSPNVEARITDCWINDDGTATIVLDGKTHLVIVDPPQLFYECVGTRVVASDGSLWIRDIRWAKAVDRKGRRMRLVRR